MNYHVIIIGGGISGSLCALEIKRHNPNFKILILEKSGTFHKKVGESSSDITAIYFRRSPFLKLAQKHLHKTGLRFWFHEKKEHNIQHFYEYSSPSYKSIANGFQFNRGILDQDLLDQCVEQKIEVLRPAEVTHIECSNLINTLTYNFNNQTCIISSTWLIDCSGRNRIVSQKLKWLEENQQHQTASIWAHFPRLKKMSTWDTRKSKILDVDTIAPRYNVTGHFMRHGLWWWHIPLNDDTTSLGVVYDKTIHTETNPRTLFKQLIESDQALKELTEDVENKNIKLYHYPQLAYLPKQIYAPGQLAIGDSAGFIDPLFSPGIEMAIQQILWIAPIIGLANNEKQFEKYQKLMLQSFRDRSFTYHEKYKVMGSYDIFSIWTQMDFIGYYFFHIYPASIITSWLKRPVLLRGLLHPIYRFFKWRYLTIAAARRKKMISSYSLKESITYSQVSVPKFPKLLLKFPELLSVWLFNYVQLEKDAFIDHLKSKLDSPVMLE
jgi:flavin-dependent dehydrogenase